MAERREEGNNPYADPLFVAINDSPTNPLGTIVFNGNNYLNWTRSVKTALGVKNKLGFLDGSCVKPPEGDENHQKWVRADFMVRNWLFASVKVKIAESLVYVESAKQFWDEIKERYGQTNAPQLFQLKKELNEAAQENMMVAEYYCRLKGLWDEIGALEGIPICTCEAMARCTCNILKRMLEIETRNKLMKLLTGLNSGYDQLKSNIMSMERLPPVNRAYNLVLQVEKQKQISGEIGMGSEVSALSVNKQTTKPNMNNTWERKDYKQRKLEKFEKKCTHCGMRGHIP